MILQIQNADGTWRTVEGDFTYSLFMNHPDAPETKERAQRIRGMASFQVEFSSTYWVQLRTLVWLQWVARNYRLN